MEIFIFLTLVALSVFFLVKKFKSPARCPKCSNQNKGCKILALLLATILLKTAQAQENKKPFILQHLEHKHKIDFINTTVYQQIDNYGAIYNTSHLFSTLKLTDKDEIFINVSITFGNGIIEKTEREGYTLTTTADDLEDYLKDINDTGRDYLLEAYYQKTIGKLTITGGIIDSTAFIDTNRYANDEHIQFLNSIFVNNPIALLPSYNPGIYIHYSINDNYSISGVYMQNKPDKGNVGIVELDYETDRLSLRPYYFYLFGTGENKGSGISGDYALTENSGFFFRVGNSNVDYEYFVSGGFQISKILFDDVVGFGYGYIKGSAGVENISVSEIYYLVNVNPHVAVTADIQYMDEAKSKYIYGGRLYLSF